MLSLFTRRRGSTTAVGALASTARHLSKAGPDEAGSAAAYEAMTRQTPKLMRDHLTPTASRQLTTLLDDLAGPGAWPGRAASPGDDDDVLPQGHHLVYLPLPTAASRLAADGADADHEPPPRDGRRRRLWAGGDLVFAQCWRDALRLDARPWACREAVDDVRPRPAGGVAVTLKRRYGLGHDDVGREAAVLEETRLLVFVPRPDDADLADTRHPRRPLKYPHPPSLRIPIVPPTATHLFHFSALTYNAHTIHLDANNPDGHGALLVHGPLALALMLRALAAATARHDPRAHPAGVVRRLTYRNFAPLYVGKPLAVCVRKLAGPLRWDVWVENATGDLAVKGTAEVEAA